MRRTAILAVCAALLSTMAPGWAAGDRPDAGFTIAQLKPVDLPQPPHPPHPPHPSDPGDGTGTGANQGRYSYSIPRSTVDRPDVEDGRLVHVVYYLPADKADEALDTSGVIDVSIAAQQAWMAAQTGGRRWRFDTFSFDSPEGRRTAYDVTYFRSSLTSSQVHGVQGIDVDLQDAGLVQDGKRYLIYAAVDGHGVCGEAYYPLGAPMSPSADGQYAAVYLDSPAGCSARDFASSVSSAGMVETIAQQEIMHNDGVVPLTAVRQCLPNYLHVCTPGLAEVDLDPERFDILFPYVGVPLRDKVLDIGRNDYYLAPTTLRDLSESPFLTP